jgi:hypothetical protein
MSKNLIVVLIYHRHKLLDLIVTNFLTAKRRVRDEAGCLARAIAHKAVMDECGAMVE